MRPEGLGKFKNSPHRDLNPRPTYDINNTLFWMTFISFTLYVD
jgi:hypothetical protein